MSLSTGVNSCAEVRIVLPGISASQPATSQISEEFWLQTTVVCVLTDDFMHARAAQHLGRQGLPGVEQGGHEELAALRLVVLLPQEELELGHRLVATRVPPHKAAQQVASVCGDERRRLLQYHACLRQLADAVTPNSWHAKASRGIAETDIHLEVQRRPMNGLACFSAG